MTLQQLLRDLRCTHPKLTWDGYSLHPGCYVQEWGCPDCGFWGDSTCGYRMTWQDTQQAWRDHIIDSWPNEPVVRAANRASTPKETFDFLGLDVVRSVPK